MQVDMSMTDDDKFHASSWWAKSPDFVIKTLAAHLKAAAVIWPELAAYKLTDGQPQTKAARGKQGGNARAAALAPERRSEIAREAANQRWQGAPMKETMETVEVSPEAKISTEPNSN